MSSTGSFSTALLLTNPFLGDIKGVHFDVVFPATDFTVTGATLRLGADQIVFGTGAQLPEPGSLVLLGVGLVSLVATIIVRGS